MKGTSANSVLVREIYDSASVSTVLYTDFPVEGKIGNPTAEELAERAIDVIQAVVATWDDGAALQAFVVRSAPAPDAAGLQTAFEASLDRRLSAPALPDATVAFDRGASTVYTACEVQAADRPGLLHVLAVAILGLLRS